MATGADDRVNAVAVVGDQTRRSRPARFAGGRLVAISGDVELDLREAQPLPEGARIQVIALLGEVKVLVPRGWVATIGTLALFSAVEDRTATGGGPTDGSSSRRIAIGGFKLFGDVVVRHAE